MRSDRKLVLNVGQAFDLVAATVVAELKATADLNWVAPIHIVLSVVVRQMD